MGHLDGFEFKKYHAQNIYRYIYWRSFVLKETYIRNFGMYFLFFCSRYCFLDACVTEVHILLF